MPYIRAENRERLDAHIDVLAARVYEPGELNYCITRLVLRFLKHRGVSYGSLAAVVGTLNLVSTELERRVINPYEDEKIAENGDVPEYRIWTLNS